MRVEIIKNPNESSINDACQSLENRRYTILDIIVTHPKANHYVTYAVIKYKDTK